MTETTPFEHKVTPRHTEFRMAPDLTDVTIQDIYGALVNDVTRNEMIAGDVARSVESGRCPLLLTGRTEHLEYFAARLAGVAKYVFVLKGGMGKKQRRTVAAALASVPEGESRIILATGSYIGQGFDDARLDTLFLAMPISWKGTLQQYVGRLHRLHDSKRCHPCQPRRVNPEAYFAAWRSAAKVDGCLRARPVFRRCCIACRKFWRPKSSTS